jgi:hypothetical protein
MNMHSGLRSNYFLVDVVSGESQHDLSYSGTKGRQYQLTMLKLSVEHRHGLSLKPH